MSLYISGPNLPLGLRDHAMVASPTGKGVIAIGGSNPGGFGAMDSVEILDPQGNNIWTPGMFWKSITVELC